MGSRFSTKDYRQLMLPREGELALPRDEPLDQLPNNKWPACHICNKQCQVDPAGCISIFVNIQCV